MVTVWGEARYVVLARELTKTWETIHGAPVGELLAWVKEDENRRKGEMVLIVEGHKAEEDALPADACARWRCCKAELPLKKAAALAAEIHGVKKNALYKYALEQQGSKALASFAGWRLRLTRPTKRLLYTIMTSVPALLSSSLPLLSDPFIRNHAVNFPSAVPD
jgi:hypothetical protein